jgi:hypothetical protein
MNKTQYIWLIGIVVLSAVVVSGCNRVDGDYKPIGAGPDCGDWVFQNSYNRTIENQQEAKSLLVEPGLVSDTVQLSKFREYSIEINGETLKGYHVSPYFISNSGDLYKSDLCEG